MNKSVYSIILSDDVVKQIDKQAYAFSVSRSAMINRILAEFVSYETPEKRMQHIYECIEHCFESYDSFQKVTQYSDNILMLSSALEYKYNPTIRYKVTIYKTQNDPIGEIKIHFRTQSKSLIDNLNNFYDIWSKAEKYFIKDSFPEVKKGTYIKYIKESSEITNDEQLANDVAAYIAATDRALKLYFDKINKGNTTQEIFEIYSDYINGIL